MSARRIGQMLLVLLTCGCGPQATQLVTFYQSDEFGFSFSVPEDLERVGWVVVDAEDATVRHTFTPPDTSTWEPVAVAVPPGFLFPQLSPIFVDIFNVRNPSITSVALADMKAERVSDRVLSRSTIDAAGIELAQIVHGSGDNINYETYAVGNGLGYAFLAQGAPDTSQTATAFRIDADAYNRIVATLRLTTPR